MDSVTVRSIGGRKRRGEKIVMVTATDFSWSRIVDAAGVDIILTGDSLAQVALGCDTTLPVTMDEMIVFTRAVSRGASRALVLADMPFLSYQTSVEEALREASKSIRVKVKNHIDIMLPEMINEIARINARKDT